MCWRSRWRLALQQEMRRENLPNANTITISKQTGTSNALYTAREIRKSLIDWWCNNSNCSFFLRPLLSFSHSSGEAVGSSAQQRGKRKNAKKLVLYVNARLMEVGKLIFLALHGCNRWRTQFTAQWCYFPLYFMRYPHLSYLAVLNK